MRPKAHRALDSTYTHVAFSFCFFQTEWITRQHLAELLYSKFLISIPMVLDVLVAFGPTNATVIRRWAETIFKLEPKYRTDLAEALKVVANTFDVIKSNVNKNEGKTFDDLALFSLDCAFTVRSLVVVLPEMIEMCEEMRIGRKATEFYDEVLPLLYRSIAVINRDAKSLKHLDSARIELLEFFREMVRMHLEIVLNDP